MSESRSDSRKSPLIPLLVAAIAVIALVFAFLQPGKDDSEPAGDTAAQSDSAPGSAQSGSGQSDSGQSESAQPADKTAPPQTWEELVRREPDDPMAMGEVDAPVVMVAYSEFQCTFCGKFARDTEPTLVDKYVKDGTLRIEWRDFPYLGPESTVAARGGRAAAAQGKFWEFEEAMYAEQLPPNSGNLDEDYLAAIAEDIGLDVDRFRKDLADPAAEDAVKQDFAEGQAIGVTGTPAFVINGVPVIGAQPTTVFEQAIENAEQEAGS